MHTLAKGLIGKRVKSIRPLKPVELMADEAYNGILVEFSNGTALVIDYMCADDDDNDDWTEVRLQGGDGSILPLDMGTAIVTRDRLRPAKKVAAKKNVAKRKKASR